MTSQDIAPFCFQNKNKQLFVQKDNYIYWGTLEDKLIQMNTTRNSHSLYDLDFGEDFVAHFEHTNLLQLYIDKTDPTVLMLLYEDHIVDKYDLITDQTILMAIKNARFYNPNKDKKKIRFILLDNKTDTYYLVAEPKYYDLYDYSLYTGRTFRGNKNKLTFTNEIELEHMTYHSKSNSIKITLDDGRQLYIPHSMIKLPEYGFLINKDGTEKRLKVLNPKDYKICKFIDHDLKIINGPDDYYGPLYY